jgi:8-oxo-dGTP pyrophosphatase MutT (NUDIX family)
VSELREGVKKGGVNSEYRITTRPNPPSPMRPTTVAYDFVSTLAFSPDLRKTALVQKNRPAFLAGKWTAIGGHVEQGEARVEAARRELQEEAGLDAGEMVEFAVFRRQPIGSGRCTFFATIVPNVEFAQTKTAERVMVWTVSTLPAYASDLSDDLCVLVEMAKMALRNPGGAFFQAEIA